MNIINQNLYKDLALLPPDIQGWNGNHTIFHELIEKRDPKIIIEVGTWKGMSAINMGNYVKSTNRQAVIYCVDTWLGATEFWTYASNTPERDLKLKNGYPQIYYQFLSNVVHSNLQNVIIPVPNTSTNAARYFNHNNIKADLIYIDASHEYEDVLTDLNFYSRLLAPGGIIFGDDYDNYWPGVVRAVNEFFKNNKTVKDRYWIHET